MFTPALDRLNLKSGNQPIRRGSIFSAERRVKDRDAVFTFRFNRRKSHSRGKLFYRLVQQAVAVQPTPYRSIVRSAQAGRS